METPIVDSHRRMKGPSIGVLFLGGIGMAWACWQTAEREQVDRERLKIRVGMTEKAIFWKTHVHLCRGGAGPF